MLMNYALIRNFDIANGVGVRVSLFVSGCRHHCKGCFNPEQWNFDYGTPFTDETVETIIKALDHDYIAGLTLLGGEPMEPENQPHLLKLVREVKARLPQKTIWCYSGFSFERDLLPCKVGEPEILKGFLSYLDVLVDGKFEEAQKDPSLLFRGSANQNIIDVQKSLDAGKLIPLEGVWKRTMGSGDIHEI